MKEIKNVLICGAGLMGNMMAYTMALDPEHSVTVYNHRDKEIEPIIRSSTKELVEHGIVTQETVDNAISRITFTTDLDSDSVKNADIVMEAIAENLEAKQALFLELEKRVSADCILSTNTSVISPGRICSVLEKRDRFVGIHFWNPAHLIPLVEIVRQAETSDETVEVSYKILEEAGKSPIVCNKDVPGFIGNRLQLALWREALTIVERGIADPETVDKAIKSSFGLRLSKLGPFENIDMIGEDLVYNIQTYVMDDLGDSHDPSPLLADLKAQGKCGFKSHEGFRKWTDEEIAESRKGLNDHLIDLVYNKGIK
ncbi:MAG: 3-hydroxyacyl-CoA dehydrogenase family protein [Eubacterium sp.]|nr:3-hydroxyacyl-CoA dehydrogenase family protein [Eubacterium sp.]